MTRPQTLRQWIRRLPEPHGFSLDGERVVLGKGAHRFSTVEEIVIAKDPDQVDAIDKEGSVLRTFVLRSEPREEPHALPAPSVQPETTEQKTLAVFANLLSAAYRQGASDQSHAWKTTNEQLVALASDAQSQNQSLLKLLNQMLKDVREDALAARDELEEAREARRDAGNDTAPAAGPGGGMKDFVKEVIKRKVEAEVAAKVTTPATPPASSNGAAS